MSKKVFPLPKKCNTYSYIIDLAFKFAFTFIWYFCCYCCEGSHIRVFLLIVCVCKGIKLGNQWVVKPQYIPLFQNTTAYPTLTTLISKWNATKSKGIPSLLRTKINMLSVRLVKHAQHLTVFLTVYSLPSSVPTRWCTQVNFVVHQ